ncbi:hypothetical protein J5N97_007262 [Dioscorea zingiberensis]|uniref:Uncharacterized protein n=1 Tax=Dioscorea zingiberensis TaxID=325984 RepID=A0A9D5HUD0_9LILI|nr:hypothetical protein J5N97_007262 [Dioscorea zingiberensis]
MASQSAAPAGSPPSPQVVGNAFVQQYYHILHQSPELVYRFYQDGSKLGRPEPHGAMSCITTMDAINEKIQSMDYGEYRAEIKTVDSQDSLNGGVLVLVTGYLTGKDNVKRDFTQSFFLATQDKGYFVLNDIFRYVDEVDGANDLQGSQNIANGTGSLHSDEKESLMPQEESVTGDAVSPLEEEEVVDEAEVYNPLDNEGSWVEEEPPVDDVIDEGPNNSQIEVMDTSHATFQEEVPKKSYASIVKVPASLTAPTPTLRQPPPSMERQPTPIPTPPPSVEITTAGSNTTETSSNQEAEADGHSIYIKSLPLNATNAQLEEEFKKFGPIKLNGIQVRSHKQQGFCFGFVEFEVASAVQRAIEASPITIGGRLAYVEEKRPTGSRVGGRGRFAPGRGGGFRNEGMRGRGSYGGGRGYGRGDYNNRTDYGGRGGGRGVSSGRGGEVGYQRVDHMGSSGARGGRSGPLTSPRGVTPRVSAPA